MSDLVTTEEHGDEKITDFQRWLICPECDWMVRRPALRPGDRAHCPRCNCELMVRRRRMVNRSLALVWAALLLWIPANFLPIIQLDKVGLKTHDTVWSAVVDVYASGMELVAVLVFLCSMAFPLVKLLCQFTILHCFVLKRGRHLGIFLFRIYHYLKEWGMLEVYLLGILVTIVKIGSMATLSVGVGLACFVMLLLLQIWLDVEMASSQVWRLLTEDFYARD